MPSLFELHFCDDREPLVALDRGDALRVLADLALPRVRETLSAIISHDRVRAIAAELAERSLERVEAADPSGDGTRRAVVDIAADVRVTLELAHPAIRAS